MRQGVTFEADGRAHVLRFDVNAICELEAAFGCGTDEIAARLGGDGKVPKIADLRLAFKCGLTGGLSLHEAGEVMQAVGGVKRASELLGEALALAFGTADDAEAPGDARGKLKAIP